MTTDQGVIAFDFDGTIVDSMPGLRTLALTLIADVTGRTNKIKVRYDATSGAPFESQLRTILPDAEGYDNATRDTINDTFEHEKVGITMAAEPFSDVVKSLPGLTNAGYRLAVVSSTRTNLIVRKMVEMDIWQHFHACLGVEAAKLKRNKLQMLKARYFVGDTDMDRHHAEDVDCVFYGVCRDPDLMKKTYTYSETFAPVLANLLERANGS